MDSPLRAYVLVTVQVGREYDVHDYIKESLPKEKVREVDVVYGEYDIIVWVEAESLGDLHELVLKIRSNPAVRHTTTLISAEKS